MANSDDQSVAPIGPDLQQGNAGSSQKFVSSVPFPMVPSWQQGGWGMSSYPSSATVNTSA